MIQIAPSILAANFKNLEKEFEKINKSGANLIHFDVMDGINVPNISFGFPILKAVKELTDLPIDTHLMLDKPSKYFESFVKEGANNISIPIENNPTIIDNLKELKNIGVSAGVVLNPDTPVEEIHKVLNWIDLVVIMSVKPGFGGQSFINSTFGKVKKIKEIIEESQSKAKIEIDGGISIENSSKLIENGADILVCGSAFFNSENYSNYVNKLKNI